VVHHPHSSQMESVSTLVWPWAIFIPFYGKMKAFWMGNIATNVGHFL